MNIPEALEVTNVDGLPQNKREDVKAACRKRKRSGAKSKPRNPALAASAEQVDTSSDETDSEASTDSEDAAVEAKVLVTSQRARRLDCFEAALDNFINYHIEIEQADEERVVMLRQTMTRIYEIIRSSSYYAGALVLQQPPL